jgi:hypothetical protein
MNRKIALVLVPCTILLSLGVLNFINKISWEEPTDGVTWAKTPNGIAAVAVAANGPGYLAGLKKGDILYKINDSLIKTQIDVVKNLWVNASAGRKMIYEISREGQLIHPNFFPGMKKTDLGYYYLALIGLTAFVIGLVVFFNTKMPLSRPNIFYFVISLTLYSAFAFSPTGELDFLDSVFYWLNEAAFLFFPLSSSITSSSSPSDGNSLKTDPRPQPSFTPQPCSSSSENSSSSSPPLEPWTMPRFLSFMPG